MWTKQFIAYRGIYDGYDKTYLLKHKPKINCLLYKDLVDHSTPVHEKYNIISIDSFYYPGVPEYMYAHLYHH